MGFGFVFTQPFAVDDDRFNRADTDLEPFGSLIADRSSIAAQTVNPCFEFALARFLRFLPVGQRLAHLVAQAVHGGDELAQLRLDGLGQFLDALQVFAAGFLDGGLGTADLGGEGGDALTALAGREVRHFVRCGAGCFDVGAQLVVAEDGRCLVRADVFEHQDLSFGCCVHA
ncbi:hypothetical protein D3C76_830150 [compost metagenome]